MTKLELLERLKKEGIPEDRYCLDGGDRYGRLCLEHRNNRWFIYYNNLGNKIDVKDFFFGRVGL